MSVVPVAAMSMERTVEQCSKHYVSKIVYSSLIWERTEFGSIVTKFGIGIRHRHVVLVRRVHLSVSRCYRWEVMVMLHFSKKDFVSPRVSTTHRNCVKIGAAEATISRIDSKDWQHEHMALDSF